MVGAVKFIISTGVISNVGGLWYGTVAGQYGFKELYQDGKVVLYGMQNNSADKVVFTGTRSLGTDQEIINAIDYKNPLVRDFAVQATNEFFEEEQRTKMKYHILIQCLAVFKKINDNWNCLLYTSDAADER